MKFSTLAAAFLGVLATVTSALPTGKIPGNARTDDALRSPFYITSPLQNSVYTANAIETTKWRNGINGKFKITVIEGTERDSMFPTRYVYDVEGSNGRYEWQVPEDLVGGTYAFHYEYQNGESYSGQFTVVAAEDTAEPSPITPSSPTTTETTDTSIAPNDNTVPLSE